MARAFGEGAPRFTHRDQLLDSGLWQALDASGAVTTIVAPLSQYPRRHPAVSSRRCERRRQTSVTRGYSTQPMPSRALDEYTAT